MSEHVADNNALSVSEAATAPHSWSIKPVKNATLTCNTTDSNT